MFKGEDPNAVNWPAASGEKRRRRRDNASISRKSSVEASNNWQWEIAATAN